MLYAVSSILCTLLIAVLRTRFNTVIYSLNSISRFLVYHRGVPGSNPTKVTSIDDYIFAEIFEKGTSLVMTNPKLVLK